MWGPGPHPPRAAYSHGCPVPPSRLDSSLEFTFPLSVITFVCRLRPLTRAQPKSMCVIRGRLTDRPVGVPRVVFGRATRACTYIGPLVSSAPSVITSSSRLPLVSFRLIVRPSGPTYSGPRVVPPSRCGSPWAKPLGCRPPLRWHCSCSFTFYFFFLAPRIIGLCWPTYLSCVHVRNILARVLYSRIASGRASPFLSPLLCLPRRASPSRLPLCLA